MLGSEVIIFNGRNRRFDEIDENDIIDDESEARSVPDTFQDKSQARVGREDLISKSDKVDTPIVSPIYIGSGSVLKGVHEDQDSLQSLDMTGEQAEFTQAYNHNIQIDKDVYANDGSSQGFLTCLAAAHSCRNTSVSRAAFHASCRSHEINNNLRGSSTLSVCVRGAKDQPSLGSTRKPSLAEPKIESDYPLKLQVDVQDISASSASSPSIYFTTQISPSMRTCVHDAKPSTQNRSSEEESSSDFDLSERLSKARLDNKSKKAARKAAREILRQEGCLIASRSKKGRVCHNKNSLREMIPKIQNFLKTDSKELALPPMDPSARKRIHHHCAKIGLESKSQGRNSSRRVVLYKTSNRAGLHGVNQTRTQTVPTRSRPTQKTRRYRDGEIVGASAPELDHNNKGCAMLEKMGWSPGASLGTAKNLGISSPVRQIVKVTRAGLG